MAPILAYWDARGLNNQIKLLLEYCGEEYDEKRYTIENREGWLSEKFTLDLDFPNIPYYIDGDVKLTHSLAIMKHIARKHDLAGSTDAEKRRVDLMESHMHDFRMHFGLLCYTGTKEEFEKEKKPEYVKNLPGKLKELSSFLGNNKYFAGDRPTYVDFTVYDILDVQKLFVPGCLDEFSNLKDFQQKIETIPAIAAFQKSPRYIPRPVNSPLIAHWF